MQAQAVFLLQGKELCQGLRSDHKGAVIGGSHPGFSCIYTERAESSSEGAGDIDRGPEAMLAVLRAVGTGRARGRRLAVPLC